VRALVRSATGLSLEHRIDGRDRAHLELRGDELFFVDIDLGEHHALVRIFGGDLFQHRRQRLARSAPFGPEIEDDQLGHRRFGDRLAEPVHRFLFFQVQAKACHTSSPMRVIGIELLPHVGMRCHSARDIARREKGVSGGGSQI
jgi:hypothetical protein